MDPSSAPIPGIPPEVQQIWLLYVVPIAVAIRILAHGIAHVKRFDGTWIGVAAQWIISGPPRAWLPQETTIKLDKPVEKKDNP